MAGKDEIVLKIRADAAGVQSGIAPAIKSLDTLGKEAAEASKSLDAVDSKQVSLSINQQAIAKARADIAALQDQMRRDIIVGADTKDARRRIAELQRSIRQLDDQPVRVRVESSGIDKLKGSLGDLSGMLRGGGPLAIVGAAVAAGGAMTKMAGDAESLSLSLKSVVRDGGDVGEILDELRQFGAQSPFTFPELANASKMLLSFGVASKDVVQTVKNLGEVASATQQPIGDLATIYGQMVAKGKVQSEELLQLAERGVPIYEALANILGVTKEQARELAEEGKISADAIKKIDDELAKMFRGSTAAQADTLNGKMSTLGDNIGEAGRKIGEIFLPKAKEMSDWAIDITAKLPDAIDQVKEFNRVMGGLLYADPSAGKPMTIEERVRGFTPTLENITNAASRMTPQIQAMKEVVEDTGDAWADVGKEIDDVTDSLNKHVKSLDILNGRYVDTQEALVAYEQAVDDLAESFQKNGATLDITTDAGRRNDKQVRELAGSIKDLAEARLRDAIATGGSTDAILADYEAQRASLKQTLIDLGISEQAATRYVEDLLKAPDKLKTDVELSGVDEARKELDELAKTRQAKIEVEVLLADPYRAQKLAQDLADSINQNAVTRSSVSSSSTVSGPSTVIVRPRVFIDGEPIRAVARGAAATEASNYYAATSGRRRL